VLAEIRQLTDKPVKYVVNSHWHWDHWYGTETYTHAFPGAQVVAHEKTRAMMAGPAIEFNRPGIEFRTYFVDWYMHRVYDELNGPLTDAISAIPAK
jgi:glyoxylase-like metal-dependent hydrolase (beta-lactamase superfamily II)